MPKVVAKLKAEEKKKNSSASSQSAFQKEKQAYEQQKVLDIQAAKRASENFTRASTNAKYNQNLQAYMDRLNALKNYGYDVSKPVTQIQQEMKRIQPAVQQENRYMQALQEQRDLERRKREARNSQPWAVRVGLVDPNEAEMTFGVYDPSASERGRLSNALAAGGKGWLAGQQNALGFALDPSQPDEAEMFFGKAPTSKLGEKISGKINEALFNQSQRLYGAADELNRQALEHETAAKQGLGKFGQTLVDVGMAGTQMALDAGIGAATGTGMASMGTRTFGQSAREALDSGATYQQAMDYGALSAAVELGTEKMFDVAKIFGGGGLDKAIEKWIVKYAKTPAGMTILRTIAGAGGEGLEEIVSSAVNPLLRSGYDPNAMQDYKTSEYWADMLHEGLVGALLGGIGVAGNVITGGNARMVNEVNREALNQRLQRADAFNEARRKLFAGNTMQTGTADAEAARVLARNIGTQGARDAATVRRAAQEQYGGQVKAVESVFEAGTADAETFQRQFKTAYDLGKEGAALDVVMNTPATADLNELQRENAWAIGREAGIREGTIKEEANANGETVRVRGSGERDAGQSSAGQVQQVEGNAGSYQEGRSLGIGRSAKDSAAADLRYSEEVKSARDLGIENGAVIKNLRTVDESSYTPEMREYAQEQAANGHKVTFVSGLIHAQDGPGGMVTRARGMVNGNGDVLIQADNERFTAIQIGQHEDGHLRIARGEIDLAATKDAVRESMGEERFDRAMQDYAEAYAGLDMTEDEIWEEIVCDAQGEMNIFDGTLMQNAEQRASELIRETKAQTTAGETTQQRAPPEGEQKLSAELDDRYMQAVQSGDVETAQRMVDEAAKKAGYSIKAYHQTGADFTVFDTKRKGAGSSDYETPYGIFLKPTAEDIGLRGKKQMELFVKFSNPIKVESREDLVDALANDETYFSLRSEITARNAEYDRKYENARDNFREVFLRWKEEHPGGTRAESLSDSKVKEAFDAPRKLLDEWSALNDETSNKAKERIVSYLRELGYDGIILENDRGSFGRTTKAYIALASEQVKSAAPVTYDDGGNIIPLSERFNPEQTDIRFSRETDIDQLARENRALRRETDELRKAVQKWKGETKLTTHATLREQDVRKAAKQMLRDYNSKADAESVSAKLRQLGELIMNGENGEAAHWSDVRGLAEEIAEEIVNAESVNVNGDEFENFQLLTGVLKEKPIHVSEADLNDILSETGYETIGAFNKAYRGTVRITTEAAKAGDKTAQDAYYEMAEAMPGWFPEDVSEAEFVPRMLEVLEGLKPVYGMSEQTSANYEAAVTWAANDVIDRVLDESIRQNPKTFADRAQAKLERTKAEVTLRERAKAGQRVENTKARMRDEFAERIKRVRASANERADARAEKKYAERSRKAIERMQARQEKQIADLKARQKVKEQNARDRKNTRAVWHKIERLGVKFRQMAEKPAQAAGKHAPIRLARALQGVAESFQFENRHMVPAPLDKVFKELQVTYQAMKDENDPNHIYYDEDLYSALVAVKTDVEGYATTGLTGIDQQQLQSIYDLLRWFEKTITSANQFISKNWAKSIIETGQEGIRQVIDAEPVANKGIAARYLNYQLSPDRFFERIFGFGKGNIGAQIAKMFADGTEKVLRIQQDFYYTFEKFSTDKRFDDLTKRGKDHLVDVGLKDTNGNPILLTHDMMLGVYEHLLSEDNLMGMAYGGLDVPVASKYYKGDVVESYEDGVRTMGIDTAVFDLYNQLRDLRKQAQDLQDISEENAENIWEKREEVNRQIEQVESEIQAYEGEIIGTLLDVRAKIEKEMSDFERELFAAGSAWMQKSADYINEETREMYGYEKANVEHYWPIHRNTDFVNTDLRTAKTEYNLENWKNLKERVKSHAPIKLTGFIFELDNHTKMMSTFCGYVAAQRDFDKLMKTRSYDSNTTLKEVIHKKFGGGDRKAGRSAQEYIDNFTKRISGAEEKEKPTYFSIVRRNLPRATLSGNIRVYVSQLASIPTAAAEVGWGNMIKGWARYSLKGFSAKQQEQLAKSNPWFWQRARGEGGMREFAEMHESTFAFDRAYNKVAGTKVGKLFLNGCQRFDMYATYTQWAMAEEWAKQRGFKPGTEEFEKAASDKYRDIIRNTQPNYTLTERSELLSDRREGMKWLTMYKTQSNQNMNILYESAARLRKYQRDYKAGKNGVTEQDLREVRQEFANSYTAVIIGGTVAFALFRTAANALIHAMNSYRDDDDEVTAKSFMNGIFKEIMSATSGMLLLGSQVYEIVYSLVTKEKYWGMSDSAIGAINDVVTQSVKVFQKVGTDNPPSRDDWTKLINSLMVPLGVPSKNVTQVINGIVNHIEDIQNGEFLSFEAGVNRTAAQETNRILNGYLNGEGDKVKRAWGELVELKGGDESKAQEAMRDGIKEAYMDGKITDKQVLDMLKRYGGKDGDDGKEYLLKWQSIQDIGVEPSKIDDAYRDGEISKKQALSALMKYKQMTQEDAQTALDKADFAEKYGFDYSESNVQKAVVDGTITPDEAMKLWKQFGKQKDSHYESLLQQVEYMKKYPDVDPELIGTQSSKDYEDYGKAANIPAADFFQYWQDIHDLQGNDKRSQGIAYIDSLSISNDKKIALFLSFWAQSSLKYCPQSWFN